MPEYKKTVVAYRNKSRDGDGYYLSIKNVSEDPIIIDPGASIFLNETPEDIKIKFPNTPNYSKSVKVKE